MMDRNEFYLLRMLVKSLLQKIDPDDWTLQGFGMLRYHFGDLRIHVWDDRFRFPNIFDSDIHDHLQWGFESTVVSGAIYNHLFMEAETAKVPPNMMRRLLKPGIGTYQKADDVPVFLAETSVQFIPAGSIYRQAPNQVHRSEPVRGTVTVMRKFPTSEDSARVYYPIGREWVSAEPRKATPDEVRAIVSNALRNF